MYTQGLDRNSLRWARENEAPFSHSSLRPRIDPSISSIKNSRGIGLPPPGIPVSRTIPAAADDDDSRSVSENDESTGSDDDTYSGRRYSLDSSPQDERMHNSGNAVRRGAHYASGYGYSDVSSSMETVTGRKGTVAERSMRVRESGGYSVGYTEEDDEVEEESDSAASSEVSTTQTGSVSSAWPRTRLRASDGYASSVPSRANMESVVPKDLHPRNLQNKNISLDNDTPSAPPFGSDNKIKEGAPEPPSTMPKPADSLDSCGLSNKNIPNKISTNSGVEPQDTTTTSPDKFARATADTEAAVFSGSNPTRFPTFHASALGPWHAVIAYDGCVRLCLHAWARGCVEAPIFLENECALLRDAFGVKQMLLQSEEELLEKHSSELVSEGAAPKPKKIIGKMKVQVRKVKTVLDTPTGCNMPSLRAPKIKLELVRYRFSKLKSRLYIAWKALRKVRVAPRPRAKGSFSHQSFAYVHASTQYIKQVSGLLKTGVTSLRNNSSSYEVVQETYSCLLRMKSSAEEDAIKMQPGSGETHVFFPDSLGDDLIVEVQDSKRKYYGRVLAQVATIAEDPVDKLRWWSIYREPEHELVGKVQLYINYSSSSDDSPLKCGSVAETVAYDLLLEVAMKVQSFQQRKLLLRGPWKWLLTEFASYYGVSDAYTKLRYLSYVMDVSTPTADCLNLVCELLMPVIMNSNSKTSLSHQENRILGEVKDQIEQILSLVFENYKSLDESSYSGIADVFKPATGLAPPALKPAVKLFTLLHDIFSAEAQTNLTHSFQAASRKRSRRLLTETDEYVVNNNETLMHPDAMSAAYRKMTSLCVNIKYEIQTDFEIHNQHILPSFIDLPNLSSSIYSSELCSRLRAFLLACPPSGPSPHVVELVVETADFEKDLASWNISPVKGGVDAKELFHLYIMLWIQDKRLSLLDSCKLDKVKWSGVKTQHSTTPFVDEMYVRLRETLVHYEVIIRRWPEYIFELENAIADVEKATIEALDKQYADVLAPLKDNLTPKKFGLSYVKKFTKRSVCPYTVPDELGILLNSMKRMLDVLRPEIETRFKSWGACIRNSGNTAPGERLSEVTVMLRAKFRGYLQAVVEKLAENSKLQSSTKLKKILQESKESVVESDIRGRLQPLKDQLINTINQIQSVFGNQVFVAICRGYWDRMGQDVLSFLENRKENRSWYKGSRIAISVLDDIFASQMQQLLGNALQAKDMEPPRSVVEVRSILCKDTSNQKDGRFYY